MHYRELKGALTCRKKLFELCYFTGLSHSHVGIANIARRRALKETSALWAKRNNPAASWWPAFLLKRICPGNVALLVCISVAEGTHLCPGVVPSPRAAAALPGTSKWFCCQCVQALPPLAGSCYFKLWLSRSRKGCHLPCWQICRCTRPTFFFFF